MRPLLWVLLTPLALGCGGPLVVTFEADLEVPRQADALEVEVVGTGNSDFTRYAEVFALSRPGPLRESLELVQGEALDDDVEIRAIARLGGERVASGARVRDLDDGGELTLRLVPWLTRGCEDPDGDDRGDGPGCLDFDCDETNPEVFAGAEELCNGVDDDCDLIVDEGCSCELGEVLECGVLEGVCFVEVQVCTGVWDECERAAHLRSLELCDGRDNDCDGRVDEGCP